MSYAQSKYLSVRALKGLDKLGDIMIPGDGEFPKFSDTGCIYHVDEVMEATHPEDVKLLNLLLTVFHFSPSGMIKLLARMTLLEEYLPSTLGAPFRLVGIALRGVPMTLYYSNLTSPYYNGPKVHDVMGYSVNVEVESV